jgi:hypothetical protein
VPTFCRHGRLEATCPVCSRKAKPAAAPPRVPRRAAQPRPTPKTASAASSASINARRRASRQASGVTVRRLAGFAADDGYDNQLVPGLRASADAARLAVELAFATARLRELQGDPPGLLAEVATLDDRDAAADLCFLVAYLSPLEGVEDPFVAIAAARDGAPLDDLPRGPRGLTSTATPEAWRRFGGGAPVAALRGDPSWAPPRRFERAFERLALPGLARPARYELLVLLGRLGVVEARPWSLELSSAAPEDPVIVAAKRVFGIGDVLELTRRVRALAGAASVPVAAFDLGLRNFATPVQRVTAGARTTGDPEIEERIAAVLGVELPGTPNPAA